MTKYYEYENIASWNGKALLVIINEVIANLFRIKEGDYLIWIIDEEKNIYLKKVSDEQDDELPNTINKKVKVQKNNRITIPKAIRLAAHIENKDIIKWKLPVNDVYTDILEVEVIKSKKIDLKANH